MRYADTAVLIQMIPKKTASGYVENEEIRKEVYCGISSVKRSEYYAGLSAGIEITMVLCLRVCDYDGQAIAEYKGKRYKVVRTYTKDGEFLELNCQEARR